MPLVGGASLPGLNAEEQTEVSKLWDQFNRKIGRNKLREEYYDAKNLFKNLRIAVPPQYESLELVLGWPAMAVDRLAQRIRHEGFALPGGDPAAFGIPESWADNQMDLALREAVTSALIHSVSFLAATEGGENEPDVVYSVGSALNSTGIWDARTRRLRSAMFVVDADDYGAPLHIVFFFPGVTVTFSRDERSQDWTPKRVTNKLPWIPVEPLVFKPRLERPFGSSRISRPVMSITDSALRTVVRGELGAEFYGAPQRWIMGAPDSMFKDDDGNPVSQWQAIIGRVWAAPMVEDAEGMPHLPQVGQFQATSPQAHGDMLRLLAQQFAGETSLPVASLGVSQESNPASAEAINASREDLIYLAESVGDTAGAAVNRIAASGVMLRDGLSEAPKELKKLQSRWRNPATMTRASAADAALKTIQALPWLAESRTALEMLDWDSDTIDRVMAERAELKAAQPQPAPVADDPSPDFGDAVPQP